MSESPTESSQPKPLLIYDGDCAFCRRWVNRWKAVAADRLNFEPYQTAAAKFPKIPPENFEQAVHLIEPNGQVHRGADAAYTAMSLAGQRHWPAWMYRNVPGFAGVSEFAYDFVSAHRGGVDSLDRFFLGKNPAPSTYFLTRRIFSIALGVVYLIAIISLWTQINGLVGSHGILPIAKNLPPPSISFSPDQPPPTLLAISTSDFFLHALCAAGTVLAILLILDIAPAIVLAMLFAIYLSLTIAGQVFLEFQWDALLLETTFLAIFFSPLQLRPRLASVPRPSKLAIFMLCFLAFRLNFMSGLTKLTAGDPNWQNGTAMQYHYETQPLPAWTSWYMHHLSPQFQQMSVKLLFFVELFLPFLIFLPRRMRRMAFVGLVAFQLLLITTGNYGYFNLLAIAICIPILDDSIWPEKWRKKIGPAMSPLRDLKWRWPRWILAPVFIVLMLGATLWTIQPLDPPFLQIKNGGFTSAAGEKSWRLMAFVSHWRVANSYGLFRVMTTTRNELIIQGSNDGITWKDYEFHFKPGDPMRRPAFTFFNMPRLDWQMWFQALDDSPQQWFDNFLSRLQSGEPAVLNLLKKNPFPDFPPKMIRVIQYDYHFTTPQEKNSTGAWWTRREVRQFESR